MISSRTNKKVVILLRCTTPLQKNLQHRNVHISQPKNAAVTIQPEMMARATPRISKRQPSLAILSTSSILRTYFITSITSSPFLFRASLALLRRMLHPQARILNPERNPLLSLALKHTFYKQFCAGEYRRDVVETIAGVKSTGYRGVILEYALEVLDGQGSKSTSSDQIQAWHSGMFETVAMCSAGDFVALKWSGLGTEALHRLDAGHKPSSEMQITIDHVCDLAVKKNVGLLPGAELEKTNTGIHDWTLDMQQRYNKEIPGKAIMFSTYQAYLRSTPKRIASDLATAQREGFTLGIKLVRGAYLESEPAAAIVDTKQATDDSYDGIIAAILRRQWNNTLQPLNDHCAEFPPVSLVVATHNAKSIELARTIRDEQAVLGQPLIECTYAQLQGMADEVSCNLLASNRKGQGLEKAGSTRPAPETPRTYKFVTWGTVAQCLNYLYRRALENQDAASRTQETRRAMASELVRRIKASIGLDP